MRCDCALENLMSKSARKGRATAPTEATQSFRVASARIAAAQKILGTATATETIDAALDLVMLREELLSGSRALAGLWICSPDE